MDPYKELKQMLEETPEAHRLIVSESMFRSYYERMIQELRYSQPELPDSYSWGPIEYYDRFTLQKSFTTFRGIPVVVLRWT